MSHNYPFRRQPPPLMSLGAPRTDLGSYSSADRRHAAPDLDFYSQHEEPPARLLPSSFPSSYASSSSSSRGQWSADGGLNILSSCGLEPSDLSLLAELPEDILTVESLPHVLREIKGKRVMSEPHPPITPGPPSSFPASLARRPPSPPSDDWDRLRSPVMNLPMDPPVMMPGPLLPERDDRWQEPWENPRRAAPAIYTPSSRPDPAASSPSSSYMMEYNHQVHHAEYGMDKEDDDDSFDYVPLGGQRSLGGRGRTSLFSHPGSHDNKPAPPADNYRPKTRQSESTSHKSRSSGGSSQPVGAAKLPSKKEALDFHGTTPEVYPYRCCLCDITVLSEMVWIKHINGTNHADGQLTLLQRFPSWDCRMETVNRRLDLLEQQKDERVSTQQNSNSQTNKSSKKQSSKNCKVVCIKFPINSVDEQYLRKLVEPFGELVKIVMFPSVAFVELATSQKAKDMVNFHKKYPPTVDDQQIQFSVSSTFNFVQDLRVLSFTPAPGGPNGQSDLVRIVRRFGPPLYTLFLSSMAFVEMKKPADAQNVVDYYSSTTLRINSDFIKVAFSGQHRTLARISSAKSCEEETTSMKRTRSLSLEKKDKTTARKRRRSNSKPHDNDKKKEDEKSRKETRSSSKDRSSSSSFKDRDKKKDEVKSSKERRSRSKHKSSNGFYRDKDKNTEDRSKDNSSNNSVKEKDNKTDEKSSKERSSAKENSNSRLSHNNDKKKEEQRSRSKEKLSSSSSKNEDKNKEKQRSRSKGKSSNSSSKDEDKKKEEERSTSKEKSNCSSSKNEDKKKEDERSRSKEKSNSSSSTNEDKKKEDERSRSKEKSNSSSSTNDDKKKEDERSRSKEKSSSSSSKDEDKKKEDERSTSREKPNSSSSKNEDKKKEEERSTSKEKSSSSSSEDLSKHTEERSKDKSSNKSVKEKDKKKEEMCSKERSKPEEKSNVSSCQNEDKKKEEMSGSKEKSSSSSCKEDDKKKKEERSSSKEKSNSCSSKEGDKKKEDNKPSKERTSQSEDNPSTGSSKDTVGKDGDKPKRESSPGSTDKSSSKSSRDNKSRESVMVQKTETEEPKAEAADEAPSVVQTQPPEDGDVGEDGDAVLGVEEKIQEEEADQEDGKPTAQTDSTQQDEEEVKAEDPVSREEEEEQEWMKVAGEEQDEPLKKKVEEEEELDFPVDLENCITLDELEQDPSDDQVSDQEHKDVKRKQEDSAQQEAVKKKKKKDEEEPNEEEPDFPVDLENCITLDELEQDAAEDRDESSDGRQKANRVLYLANLPACFYTDDAFLAFAKRFGKVVRYLLLRSRNQGFVEMSSSAEALRVLKDHKNKTVTFKDHELILKMSNHNKLTIGYPVPPEEDLKPSSRRSQRLSKSRSSESNRKSAERNESSKKTSVSKRNQEETSPETVSNSSQEKDELDTKPPEDPAVQTAAEKDSVPETRVEHDPDQRPRPDQKLEEETGNTEEQPEGGAKPAQPVGVEFVRPVVGYMCTLCNAIYADEDEAKQQHCSSVVHRRKYQEHTKKMA